MEILIRFTSARDVHRSEQHFWPDTVPLALPAIGDGVDLLGHGHCKVTGRTFTYGPGNQPRADLTAKLIVDIACS